MSMTLHGAAVSRLSIQSIMHMHHNATIDQACHCYTCRVVRAVHHMGAEEKARIEQAHAFEQ